MTDNQQETAATPARLFASPNRAPDLHLVIVHQPGWQSIEDWYAIASRVVRINPAIAAIVVSAGTAGGNAAQYAATHPTLVFSPGPLGLFSPRRGKVYHGQIIPKIEQLRRMAQAGVSIPRSMLLRPDSKIDPADWGEFVVVKPTDIGTSSHGAGVTLMRTGRVRYIAPEDYPEGHPGRFGPMVVQQFIDTGKSISAYRVLTLFGQALYCELSFDGDERADLVGEDRDIEAITVAVQAVTVRHRRLVYEADVVALAAAAHRAIPEAPMQGCDIIRDMATGRLYVLELNPGGNTWHFSSSFLAETRARFGPDYDRQRLAQIDAFGTAAQVLAERTRLEAE